MELKNKKRQKDFDRAVKRMRIALLRSFSKDIPASLLCPKKAKKEEEVFDYSVYDKILAKFPYPLNKG
tara:strand:- start:52143 stop:52346 length:204 start_codon:yes stop_codon:yes gene_type:complete